MTKRAKTITAVDDVLLAQEVEAILGPEPEKALLAAVSSERHQYEPRSIVTGFIVGVDDDSVVVDIGYKSEGIVSIEEFAEGEAVIGAKVQVMITEVLPSGELLLSKRQADLQIGWNQVLGNNKEGDRVRGKVVRKIKGGLLVDIGVPVFLPASQVDLRRTADVGDLVGQEIEAEIIKIDAERKNIVISRRKVLEEERKKNRETLAKELQVGDLREGVVKNITEFGAFIDLGGLDGLLHITDMSWGRINHPSEMVKIGQKLEVVVLDYDAERNRISLGLKQKTRNPWEDIDARYPVGSVHEGEVVNLMNYGAFVKLEDGIEGLVHISEMSWTRTPSHPSELVKIGDKVRVMVLEIDHDKQEISLGMKQAEGNPWDTIRERFPIGSKVEGVVKNITNYGAFVEIAPGIEGLLHVNDISWTKKLTHPSPEINKGDKITCVILDIDRERQRISLGMKQLTEDPWIREIPSKVKKGLVLEGKISKVTNFGVFVDILDGIEALLHSSELGGRKVEELSPGQTLKVKVLHIDTEARKIGLTLRGVA
ncbi:MAG: 30S ribosomal protein S1 [Planctomycetota bacterium]|nr:30S ribosomal protein S1 [Planctomycetota bacterium]MCX8038971.1 30S ribosomal protein S1 [Planctomycetota bacterium]MDW8372778.1 30S ribosomal protein S1 [Planctomycetota bacterium]